MTGDESRELRVDDRAHRKDDARDAGTVAENTLSGVVSCHRARLTV
jgi:hypothetical protein